MTSRTSRSRRLRRGGLGIGLSATLWGAAACPKQPEPSASPVAVEAAPRRPPVEKIHEELLDDWFRAHPVYATTIGDHRFDGAWPRLTEADIEADRRRIDDSLARLDALDPRTLRPEQRVDLDILRNALERQRFAHEVEQPWRRDPMWYASRLGGGLEDLVSRGYAPVGERAQATASRLEGLPTLTNQAIANLQPGETMEPHTRIAIGQLDGVIALIDEIPVRLAEAGAADLQRIEAARPAAREAVQALRAHVETRLLPEARAPWRLGKEAFERKLKLTLDTTLTAEELRRLAILEHAQIRTEMAALAEELAEVLFTAYRRRTILRQASADPRTALIAAVLEELSEDRVTPPQLRDRVERTLVRLDRFVRDEGLVTLDDAEVLEVIWTPPHQQGVAIAGLAAPGPLDASTPGLPSFYLVQPVPEDWPRSYKESFLREYNNFMLEILSIHEAIPGHFVQLYYGKREPSKVRRVLANGAFVEGWAVYAERVMVEAGYDGAPPQGPKPEFISRRLWTVMNTPRLRAKAVALHRLKFYLRTVTNAILDHLIHAGTMDELGALELMVVRSFQQEGEAKAKWVRAQVTATQLSTYFVGAQAWFRLREQAEQRAEDAGHTFDLRAFHDQALSHGAPPVHRLPELMGWTSSPADATSGSPLASAVAHDPATASAPQAPTARL